MKKQFGFTFYATEESDVKINFHYIEKQLNKAVELTTYGKGIEKIYFAFTAVPSSNLNHDEEMSFKSSDKRLLIRKKLPFDFVLNATSETVEKLMAQTFFLSLQHIEFLRIEYFNTPQFLIKIENLFPKNGWLENVQSS